MVEVGSTVTYVDPKAQEHNALVTAVWTPTCINIVVVEDNENQKDDYGRKIKRITSLVHQTLQPAHGNYWK